MKNFFAASSLLLVASLVACSSEPLVVVDGTSKEAGVDGAVDSAPDAATPEVAAPTCDATNCTGCCLNGTCQAGLTVASCGKGGAACAVCSGTKVVCTADQTCGIDPASTWRVQPKSAVVSTKNGTSDWDVGAGLPDPYVSLWCSSIANDAIYTPTVTDSLTPTWTMGGCTMKAKELLALGFSVAVSDEDIAVHDEIASKSIVKVTEKDLLSGSIAISKGSTLIDLKIGLSPL